MEQACLKVEDLYRIKGEVLREAVLEPGRSQARVTVHMGTCGISSGADKIYQAIREECRSYGRIDIVLTTSGCAGICNREPLITVERMGEEAVKYAELTPESAREIFRRHVLGGEVVDKWALARGWEQPERGFEGPSGPLQESLPHIKELPFFGRQELRVMRNRGLLTPESLEQYIASDGYFAAAKALYQMSPQEIIQEIKASGLRGRGGAGFPTGIKWEFAAKSSSQTKYVLCNADEGDPGAFMDRCVLESDPHSVLEGMLIAAKAIGARQGYIYCRAEYPLAVHMLNLAIAKAQERGLLGQNILGTGFAFDVAVYRGAGAFVCGEETALINSLEGRRGMPRPRPPFPALKGLWNMPTILNNVETLSSVPQIILKGAKWYSAIGTARSKGTKVFALTGDVRNVGLVEVPMDTPLGDIIFDVGGGMAKQKRFKAVQLGGPSGGCVPARHLNTPVEYEGIVKLGAIVGSGGMIVMNEDKCMVDMARFFMEFCVDESCGKCTPCRVGTRQMLNLLTRICQGQGQEGDIACLEKLAALIQKLSLCGLGQTAPNPVLSTIRYFRDEYDAHIRERRCPAAACAQMFKAPCQHACPLGTDIPAYTALVRAGRLEEAYQVLLATNPFPGVCGRVCEHPCEGKCRRAALDEPVHIRQLKRFVTDYGVRPPVQRVPVTRMQRIAVIGGGPSGLTAAHDLALRGYAVTVFEAMPEAGGLLRWGIPAYRLSRDVLRAEIAAIQQLGVDLRCGIQVGYHISWQEIKERFSAIYVAAGAGRSLPLGVEGEHLEGVVGAVDFLRAVNSGQADGVGRRVAVVGGGNCAVDAARCARRLGADSVTIYYRRLREDMPAQDAEIRAAEEEGVRIEYLTAPIRLQGTNGRVSGMFCQRMTLGEFDSGGRRRPLPILGAEFSLEVDQVISAIGQTTAPAFWGSSDEGSPRVSERGLIQVKEGTRTRAAEALVFAGGDVVTGPSTVVWAIAAGHWAAEEIDAAFRAAGGEPAYRPPVREPISIPLLLDEEIREKPRRPIPEVPVAQRVRNFSEVELSFNPEEAQDEAARCLRCDASAQEAEPALEPREAAYRAAV